MSDVTRILSQIESGDPSATEKLLPLVYEELRTLASAKLANEKPGQTLQATALVHEAYVQLTRRRLQPGTTRCKRFAPTFSIVVNDSGRWRAFTHAHTIATRFSATSTGQSPPQYAKPPVRHRLQAGPQLKSPRRRNRNG